MYVIWKNGSKTEKSNHLQLATSHKKIVRLDYLMHITHYQWYTVILIFQLTSALLSIQE